MRVVVPFDAREPKTRLGPVLDAAERDALARCMLRDVLVAVDALDAAVEVVATAPVDVGAGLAPHLDDPDPGRSLRSVPVTVDERPLSAVVDAAVDATVGDAGESLAVVMADLALATPAALARLVDAAGDVVVAPGRGAGTNALVVRSPAFRADFHGASYLDHRAAADAAGLTLRTVDSRRLSTDVDEPADLVEAYVDGGEATAAWLTDRFEVAVDEAAGRVSLARR
jgi:2-phospho-L-lactate guanylyltransferase